MNGRAKVHSLQKRLDAAFARAIASSSDLEVQSDYAKYLCVLVSGFLENAITELIVYYAQNRSAPEVSNFVEKQLDHWTNPNTEKIAQLFGQFSSDWFKVITSQLVDEKKDCINSLVSLRHKIAHGESVGTSLSQIKKYYKTVQDVVEFLSDIVDPRSPTSQIRF
ncbi:MAG: hypothetical protein HZC25_18465 [Rhodospirillales bacterium]|nr:hypothetical protein [Rhodospirillales bacterium]